jgi:hypothetical protein
VRLSSVDSSNIGGAGMGCAVFVGLILVSKGCWSGKRRGRECRIEYMFI